ncbi:hypothetical protein FQR65_LT14682 [Abscondita terminalis]|nr:hypothetical protein FQR65_LT14682 [Abscondita terminalis]
MTSVTVFWAAVTATVAGILCACSLWRRHSQRNICCSNSGRDDRASEPDSNGSCYAPPHYSRCNSFHQAPHLILRLRKPRRRSQFSDLLFFLLYPSYYYSFTIGTVTTSTMHSHEIQQYSVVNSITSSDISSLANFGTPDSPPRATSPTGELRELLDKIQQLPQQKSPTPDTSNNGQEVKTKSCFSRNKAKKLYSMPLSEGLSCNYLSKNYRRVADLLECSEKVLKAGYRESAPNTPCGNFAPNFPNIKKHCNSQKR